MFRRHPASLIANLISGNADAMPVSGTRGNDPILQTLCLRRIKLGGPAECRGDVAARPTCRDDKTIRISGRKTGEALHKVCVGFHVLMLGLGAVVIDGKKLAAVDNRDRDFTHAKMTRRLAQIEPKMACCLGQLDGADLRAHGDCKEGGAPEQQMPPPATSLTEQHSR